MSRTYRTVKRRRKCLGFPGYPRMYYGIPAHFTNWSRDRLVSFAKNRGSNRANVQWKEGRVGHDFDWYYARVLNLHVFRNRSSYRQRINAIRLTKKVKHGQIRAQFQRELRQDLDEWFIASLLDEQMETEHLQDQAEID